MTMIACIHHDKHGPLLCGDACASVAFRGGASGTFHRDEMQKVFAFAPHLALAYATDDVTATQVLLRSLTQDRSGVEDALTRGTPEALTRLLEQHHARNAISGAVILLGAVVASDSGPHLLTWDSRVPDRHSLVMPGTARVLGSGQGLPEVVAMADTTATVDVRDEQEVAAAFATKFVAGLREHQAAWTQRGVGGLLQICVVNSAGVIAYSEGEAASFSSSDGLVYEVEMVFENGGWIQRNLVTKKEIAVVNVLAHDLKPTADDNVFML